MTWFETHAHLSDPQFDADRETVVGRALEQGVQTLVEIADGPLEWPKAQALAEKYKNNMWWAAGIHPYYADQATPQILDQLAALASHPQFVAVGEIGLDYAKCPLSPAIQQQTFEDTLHVATKVQKPFIIHCRDAFQDLLPILQKFYSAHKKPTCPGVIHCFTGTTEHAQACLELGFYLGVDAPITYPKAQALRDTFKQLPLDRLVLETDSPYLPPQPFRGKRNEPSYLPLVGETLAGLHHISTIELATTLLNNSRTLFRLS